MKNQVIAYTFLFFSSNLFAQDREPDFWNDAMRALASDKSTADWVYVKNGVTPNPQTFFTDHAAAFNLSANDAMQMHKEKTDDLGFTHYRYQQYYKGVKVDGAEFIVHKNSAGKVYLANGKMAKGLTLSATPSISAQRAIAIATDAVPATQYYWEMPFWESQIKEQTENPNATYYPVPELVVSRNHNSKSFAPRNFRLAYKVDIRAFDPWVEKTLFIDAMTGDIFNELPLAHSCTGGSINLNHYGSTTVYTQAISGGYRLFDECHTANIHVRDWNGAGAVNPPPPNPQDITSTNNTWNNTTNQEFGASTLWALSWTQQYFRDVHNRYGYNASNGSLNVFINAVYDGGSTNNASYHGGGIMTVGIGRPDFADSGFPCISADPLEDAFNTVDIMGHEFGHGVDGEEANLTYQGESGALDESFADIYGCMVEHRALSSGNDWLMGAQRCTGYIRNISDPNDKDDPDTYNGTHWKSTAQGASDYGGVHSNSGVQNFWFYLLCDGGSGTNDIGSSYDVYPIGYEDAEAVAYRNHAVYLVSSSGYNDARMGSIQAAGDLFGWPSNQQTQTINAWYAVGVGVITETRVERYPVCEIQSIGYSGKNVSFPVQLYSGRTYKFHNCGTTSDDTKMALYGKAVIVTSSGSVTTNLLTNKLIENDNACGLQSSITYTTASSDAAYFYLLNITSPSASSSGTLYYQEICPLIFNLTAKGASFLGNEGLVQLSFSGDYASPATFHWSNGATTQILTGIPAGTYCVTVTDANGVTGSKCATVDAIPCYYPKTLTYSVTDAGSVDAANGAINLTVNNHPLNGTRTYGYLWSTGATTEDLASLSAGIYDVTVTDNQGCITKGRTYVNQPHVNDGPLKLTLRVVQVFARDHNDILGDAENTWLVSAKDSSNVDGSDWLSSVCITKNVPASGFIAGDGYRSGYSPATIATIQYGATTPQFYRLKIDAWEDDCTSRCTYETSCNLGFDADDARCNEEININIPFRYQAINQWNDDGWFYTCNTATGPQYGVRVESLWEYTAIPANTTLDGPIRLEVRADYVKARDYNDVTGNAENAWKFNVSDSADLDGQASKQTCLYYSIPSASFPYTSPSAAPIFDKIYPSLVPVKYYFTMEAWEEDRGDECVFDSDASILNDDDDAYCYDYTNQIAFRLNIPGVWHVDGTNDAISACSDDYGIGFSSRWSYVNGDNPGNPIVMGTASCDSARWVSTNTSTVYTHNAASPQPSKDVYYQFELKEPADVIITTCNPATNYDSYLYLTDLSGAVIDSNDDLNYPTNLCSYFSHNNLQAGKYNIIVEGYGTFEGVFELSVDAVPRPVIQIVDMPAVVCVHSDTVFLTGNPIGGTFSGPGVSSEIIFEEDFEGGMPPNFTLFNFDGLTPDANVSSFTDAWVTRPDNTNTVAASTSWYSPVGAADDWLITPLISLADNPILTWKARAVDPAYPDGYEVRIASSIGNEFIINPPLFSTPAESTTWTSRTVNLSAYAGQAVYIAFRNNSNDKYILHVDDIVVSNSKSLFVPDNAGPGTHIITYSGINSNGCFVSASKNIKVAPLPDASFSGLPDTICPTADSVTIVSLTAGGSFFGNGTTDSSFFFYPAYAALGENIISYTVTDSNGCQNIASDTIIVTPIITNQSVNLCAGDSFFVQQAWRFTSGIYRDTLVTGKCDSIIVTELTAAEPLLMFFDLAHVSQAGNDGSINLSIIGGTFPYEYLWSTTDSTKDIANLTAGTYSVTVTDSLNCMAVDSAKIVPLVKISGTLLTANGNSVTGALVKLTGTQTKIDTADGSGYYSFDVPQGADLVVEPVYRDAITTICVSAIDMILIQRHILDIHALGSPYKIMAADVNISNSVTTIDLGFMRSLILGNDSLFPKGRLWTFVSSDFAITDSLNPFQFDTSRSYANLSIDTINQDFTGIRLGDVNNTCDALNPRLTAAGEVEFNMNEYYSMPGNEITIPVKVKDFKNIAGYQFTLSWNPEVLSFLEVNNGSLSGFFGTNKTTEGFLTTLWSDETGGAKSLADEAEAFELKFNVVGATGSYSEIKIGSEITSSEAYNDDLELLFINSTNGRVNVGDIFTRNPQPATHNTINLSVQPNPFNNTTNIIFNITKSETVSISIYDLLGKEVKSIEANYTAGAHKIEWGGEDKNGAPLSSGLYHIRMKAGNETQGVKVALVR